MPTRANARGKLIDKTFAASLAASVLALSGCSSSDDQPTAQDTPTPVTLSGVIYAPNGQIAFNRPSAVDRALAALFGSPAQAAIDGVSNVGAGVTVNLIEVDASGAQVGDVIATGTTNADGSYSVAAPAGFAPGSQYVLRAVGTTQTLDARVTATENDVDPASDAASDLVTATASDLSAISVAEIEEILESVEALVEEVDTNGLGAEAFSAALQSEANNDESVSSLVTNTTAAGQICGTVTDSSGAALERIRIIVRDFGEWVVRTKGWTDSSGQYCVNVADGDYIVAALNFSATNMGASEWWHTNGTAYTPADAEKVTVAANTVTRDFALEPGGRLEGTVSAADTGAGLSGIHVTIRDYQTYFFTAIKRSNASGSYRINVIPGTYMAVARNLTLKPYGTEVYDGATGSNLRNKAEKITVTAGTTQSIDFALEAGYKLSGQVLDDSAANGGQPVTGTRIRVDVNGAGPAERLRTRKDGTYRIWLKPGVYDVNAYGQEFAARDMSAANAVVNFDVPVGHLPVTVQDSAGNPVSRAVVILRDSTTGNRVHVNTSSEDGTLMLQSAQSGNFTLEARIDSEQAYGSSVYDNQTQWAMGTPVSITVGSTATGVPFTLPDAGVLVGTVTSGGQPVGDIKVQVRSGGLTGAERFITTFTRGDGTYTLSLPAGTYDRVIAIGDTSNAFQNSVTVTAGATTTQDFTL